jgi:hypothetical protein
MNFTKNKFISLLLLFLVNLSKATEIEKSCDGQKLINCYIDYLSTFLLPTLPSPPSYNYFARLYLDAQCKGGWNEQEILCNVQNQLVQCMKGNEECLKTSEYQQYLNLDEFDARSYQTDYKVRQYQCGSGKNNFQNMYFCYLKVVNYYDYEIQRCNEIQNSIVAKNGSNASNCSKANEYVACMSSVFGRRCGTATKGFICNIAEITVKANIGSDTCDSTMQKCSSSFVYP